jgi:hypothetical protein
VPCHPWCKHRGTLAVKNNFFSFLVAVNNSITVGPLVFLLYMFVIMENITKHPVLNRYRSLYKNKTWCATGINTQSIIVVIIHKCLPWNISLSKSGYVCQWN